MAKELNTESRVQTGCCVVDKGTLWVPHLVEGEVRVVLSAGRAQCSRHNNWKYSRTNQIRTSKGYSDLLELGTQPSAFWQRLKDRGVGKLYSGGGEGKALCPDQRL